MFVCSGDNPVSKSMSSSKLFELGNLAIRLVLNDEIDLFNN